MAHGSRQARVHIQRAHANTPVCMTDVFARMLLCMQVLSGAGELNLLRDALKALDDLFLVVVVGEFNSGEQLGCKCWCMHGYADEVWTHYSVCSTCQAG